MKSLNNNHDTPRPNMRKEHYCRTWWYRGGQLTKGSPAILAPSVLEKDNAGYLSRYFFQGYQVYYHTEPYKYDQVHTSCFGWSHWLLEDSLINLLCQYWYEFEFDYELNKQPVFWKRNLGWICYWAFLESIQWRATTTPTNQTCITFLFSFSRELRVA